MGEYVNAPAKDGKAMLQWNLYVTQRWYATYDGSASENIPTKIHTSNEPSVEH